VDVIEAFEMFSEKAFSRRRPPALGAAGFALTQLLKIIRVIGAQRVFSHSVNAFR